MDGRLLDLGYHSGFMTYWMDQLIKSEIYGIDVSENAIEYAREKYPNTELDIADL